MRGEQSRAAALFDKGDKNDTDDDVFAGVVVVGACANMYGRKPTVVLFLVKQQSKDTSKSSKRSLSFSLSFCVSYLGF